MFCTRALEKQHTLINNVIGCVFNCFVLIAKARVPERNVAKLKPAIQSSTYSVYVASRAVDGRFSDPRFGISCNLSALRSWWAVDLIERFLIQKINVWTDNNVAMGKAETQ